MTPFGSLQHRRVTPAFYARVDFRYDKLVTLEDVLLGRLHLMLKCRGSTCGEETSLDAGFFAAQYGLNMKLTDLEQHLFCTGCGSNAISLLARSGSNGAGRPT